jgi:hypothetical protein
MAESPEDEEMGGSLRGALQSPGKDWLGRDSLALPVRLT